MRVSDEIEILVKKEFISNKSTMESYKSSVNRFKNLVDRGITTVRKNQLIPLEDRYKKQVKYNTN